MKRETGWRDHAFCREGGGGRPVGKRDDTLAVSPRLGARLLRRNDFRHKGAPEKHLLRRAQADTDGLSERFINVIQHGGERLGVCAGPRAEEELSIPHKLLDNVEARRRERRDLIEQRAQLAGVGRVRHEEHDGVEAVRCLSCRSLGGMF